MLVLKDAFTALKNRTPQTKKVQKEIIIEDVKPLDIAAFMKKNNIPDDAWFGGKDNGNDGYSHVCLCYDVSVPTTAQEKLDYNRRNFSTMVHKRLYDLLIPKGYKKIPYSLDTYKELCDSKIVQLTLLTKLRSNETTIYDLYMSKDFDKILKYYSLSFVLDEKTIK